MLPAEIAFWDGFSADIWWPRDAKMQSLLGTLEIAGYDDHETLYVSVDWDQERSCSSHTS